MLCVICTSFLNLFEHALCRGSCASVLKPVRQMGVRREVKLGGHRAVEHVDYVEVRNGETVTD